MRQMAGKDEETSLEDSSFGPGHFTPPHCEHPIRGSQYKESEHKPLQ